ncbi:hypothetical protein HOY80DRAFT_616038 [Tuber brumale]|nr:hypothetical protein HOY80DRAFT_616038 [Tuber brumale]
MHPNTCLLYSTKEWTSSMETNSEENHFDRVFGAKYDSILTCPICNNRSVTPEYQLSLQLTPKANSKAMIDLKACFATNFSREYVEASCDNCGHKTEASDKSKWFSKKTEIRKLPKFLIINISRYRIGGLAQTKIMNPVNLEENLVLKEGDKDVTYQLRGMISHKGEQVRCGHYIAFVKQPDRTWARCDDTTIKQTNLKQIKLQQNTFQIYMLGYEQVTC